jgi:hypothetical protein
LSLTLIKQRRVSENGIRGRKKQGDGKELYDKELRDLYFSLNNFKEIKSRTIK